MEEIEKKLDYLIKISKGVLTEQEKQRIAMLNIEEVQKELLKNNKEMREQLNMLIKKHNKEKLYKIM